MKTLLVLITCLCCSVHSVHALESSGGLRLSRDAAVAMAVHRNIDLRVQALNTSLAKERVKRSGSFYDPYLNISSRYGETAYIGETFGTTSTNTSVDLSQYVPTGGNIAAQVQTGYTTAESLSGAAEPKDWLSSVGITISQPLLKDAGREVTNLNITLSDNSRLESLESFRFFLTDTVYSVITSYNRLYVLRQIFVSRQKSLTSAEELRQQLLARAASGRPARKMEIANADYAISQRRKELIDDGKRVRDQEASLRYLLGLEDSRDIIPLDPPSRLEPPESETEALNIATENRADLKQLRLSLASSELEERVSRHQRLPNLDLTASGGFSGAGDVIGDSFDQITSAKGAWWSAGLSFSLPLGNTAAESDHRQDKIRTRQLRNQIRAYEWQIRDSVAADMRSLISARLQMRAADQSLQYAEQRLVEYRKRVNDGRTAVQDVLNAENDLVRARNSQIEAVDSFAYSVARLWRNMGVLLDRQNIHIDVSDPEQLTQDAERHGSAEDALVARGEAVLRAARGTSSPSPASETRAAPAPVIAVSPAVAKEGTSPPTASPTPPSQPRPEAENRAQTHRETPSAYQVLVVDAFRKGRLKSAQADLQQAGMTTRWETGKKKKRKMIRLLIGRFSSASLARKELSRLGTAQAEGFIMADGKGGYNAFAGSHLTRKVALAEQRRLAAKGVDTRPVEAEVPMQTWRLTVSGENKLLQQELRHLRGQGFDARLLAAAKAGQ